MIYQDSCEQSRVDKEVAEAYEALKDVEKRAAYDDVGNRFKHGQDFNPPPEWTSGFEFSGGAEGDSHDFNHSDFFESLFGHRTTGARGSHGRGQRAGEDHHAKVQIDLQDAYRGGRRSISLRVPRIDASGRPIPCRGPV